jgi:multiple antibiotic resistance protein
LLSSLGISLAALRTLGGTSTTGDEEQEAVGKQDISVFPSATPMMVKPGTMGAVILLMANTQGNITLQATVIVDGDFSNLCSAPVS